MILSKSKTRWMMCVLGVVASGSAFATRPVGAKVSGEITAPSTGMQIEVAHTPYPIKPGSAAETQVHSFYSGQQVDVEFDSRAVTEKSQVVAITKHKES